MGFEFSSANKGCEALVYSFLSIIKENLKKDDIIINFSGTQLGAVPDYYSDYTFVNIHPRLKDIRLKYVRALKKCDIIFDVTMGDSFSDIYSKSYYDYLIRNKRVAEMLCKKYILLPQTYGPFGYVNSEKKAKKVLKKAYRIYCRDKISQRLLYNNFKISNTLLVIGSSRAESRQIVNHGHICVNGKRVDIPSYQVKAGDVISVKENKRQKEMFKALKEVKVVMPKWLEFENTTIH